MADPDPKLRLRLVFADGHRFGPGKADLLQAISEEGSLAAAGRRMGMSYRRAWALVEEMNADFDPAPVERSRGGATGGGARLTAAGEDLLRRYRALEELAVQEGAAEIAAIADLRRKVS